MGKFVDDFERYDIVAAELLTLPPRGAIKMTRTRSQCQQWTYLIATVAHFFIAVGILGLLMNRAGDSLVSSGTISPLLIGTVFLFAIIAFAEMDIALLTLVNERLPRKTLFYHIWLMPIAIGYAYTQENALLLLFMVPTLVILADPHT